MSLITKQEYQLMIEKNKLLTKVIDYIDVVSQHEQKLFTHDAFISEYYKKAVQPLLTEQAGLQARIARYEIIGK